MKKLLTCILIGFIVLSITSCNKQSMQLEGVQEPKDILDTLWNEYAEDEKFYVLGGDYNNIVENAPGVYNLEDKDAAASQLVLNEKSIKMVSDAATVIHALNANSFTGAVYRIDEDSTADEFVSEIKDSISNNQWVCGNPEKMLIAEITEDYVVVAFGETKNIDTFKEKLTAKYDFADVYVDVIA